MKRLVALLPVLIALQAGVPPALAWTWPVDGPVLRPFVLGDDPYAAGQHRGIDVGAMAGALVRAPAAGAVTFAGTVPGSGRTVTIQTSDGYSVTLVHLGSSVVGRGAAVAEGATVGTVGPSGEPELAEPYVHLGVRRTSDEHGYVDPLAFLPAAAVEPPPKAEAPVADPPDQPAEAAQPSPAPGSKQPQQAAEGGASSSGAPAGKAEDGGRGRASAPARLGSARAPSTRLMQARTPARPLAVGVAEPVVAARPAPDDSAPPRRTRRASFEPVGLPQSPAPRLASPVRGDATKVGAVAGLAALLALAAGVGLAVRRRQLSDAASADRASAVLLHRVGAAAEDAGRPRPAEEDRLVLDGDLERILLAQAEPLADLYRNDDPAELVDVPDDARAPRSSSCAQACAHGNRSFRSLRRRSARPRKPLTPYRRSPVDSHCLPFQTAVRERGTRPSV
jgi:Peptidase family M23